MTKYQLLEHIIRGINSKFKVDLDEEDISQVKSVLDSGVAWGRAEMRNRIADRMRDWRDPSAEIIRAIPDEEE